MVTQGGDPYLSPPIKIEDHVVDACSPSSSDPASSPYYYSNGGGYSGSQFLPGVDSITGEVPFMIISLQMITILRDLFCEGVMIWVPMDLSL